MSGNGQPGAHEVTALLQRYAQGQSESLNDVVALVYEELHQLARQQLRRSRVGQHVQTTVLVHEAYEKLVQGKIQDLRDRRHFFAVASRAMRQIVVDTYRADNAAKRGGGAPPVTLTVSHLLDMDKPEQLVAVYEAIDKLAGHSEDLVETLDMSCFGGLSNEQIAELTGCNVRTVQRKLQRARSWLMHFMAQDIKSD